MTKQGFSLTHSPVWQLRYVNKTPNQVAFKHVLSLVVGSYAPNWLCLLTLVHPFVVIPLPLILVIWLSRILNLWTNTCPPKICLDKFIITFYIQLDINYLLLENVYNLLCSLEVYIPAHYPCGTALKSSRFFLFPQTSRNHLMAFPTMSVNRYYQWILLQIQ